MRDYITAARETPSWEQEKLYHGGRLYYGMEGVENITAPRETLYDMAAGETPSLRHGRLYIYPDSKRDSLGGTRDSICIMAASETLFVFDAAMREWFLLP